jgi:serine/threonine protein kinase
MVEVGDTIWGYKVVDLINRGGFCNAFKVEKDGKYYFMKEYTDPTKLSKDFEAFLDNQKHILGCMEALGEGTEKVVRHFIDDGHYYQVKELLKGTNLEEWLDGHGEEEDRFDIAIQLTKILQKIHAAGIVHQDLKAGQIMVVSERPLKIVLTDFDWSVFKGKVVRKVGSPWHGYVDDEPSEKTDVFTLGIMICELLTGSNPYQDNGDYEPERWYRWVKGRKYQEPSVLDGAGIISRKLNDIIVQCLSPEPADRPALDDILKALEDPEDPKRQVVLTIEDRRLIIPAGGTADRGYFKLCFPDITDKEGNPVYLYISHNVNALQVGREGKNLTLSSPDTLTNRFLLNGKAIGETPAVVKDGDTLDLFSSKKGESIATFRIAVK